MLSISRRPQEFFWIGDDIRVYVSAVNGRKVTLAIDAPRHIPVRRREVEKPSQANLKKPEGE